MKRKDYSVFTLFHQTSLHDNQRGFCISISVEYLNKFIIIIIVIYFILF